MNVRRTAGTLAALTAVLAGTAAPAAFAATASPSPSPSAALPSGLFGKTDPAYDGVWRQSLALLAQHTVGLTPAAKAVDWLAGQQCADGAFPAYRAAPGTGTPCDAELPRDTNATAAAVQALAAVGGHEAATGRAVSWLKSVQNKDGGWPYAPGGASDTNSTSVVVGALAATGADPARVRAAKGTASPYTLLAEWSVPCAKDGGGALAYQPGKKGELAANADATAAGVLAALGKGFVTAAGKSSPGDGSCGGASPLTPADIARNGAGYLRDRTSATGYLKSVLPGAGNQPDYGNTADAVVSLAALGWTGAAQKPYAWLEKHAAPWAGQSGPAAYAALILTAHAMGADPRHFGGTDLVQRLGALGPAARQKATGAQGTGAQGAERESAKQDGGGGLGVWWIVGIGLVAGAGIGFLLSGRGRRKP
ncbi:prenyltransferase/squalene oxidase repeat-containing protein [Streptomyces sp. NPDC047000]|uniref:prenyltransferase/squalene oxidase repeat-containing protein n=1 Tax=Streptomyces sp. NPDC047000 TaxID=3155474 RepID=UPI0033EE87EE